MLKITVIIKQSAAIEQLVLENKIDIALIENQPEYADIMAIPFMTDHLCAIVPVTHPLADKKMGYFGRSVSVSFSHAGKRKCGTGNPGCRF